MNEAAITTDPGRVWRVGHRPNPWAWTDWLHVNDDGRFNGRWDDQLAEFRVLYVGETLLACLLEVLAQFRPDQATDVELDEIEDPDGEVNQYPDALSGTVGYGWLEDRLAGSAELSGKYCFVTHSECISKIQAGFPFAHFKLEPVLLDASDLKDGEQRNLTRSIARWIFDLRDERQNDLVDGIQFRSRFGDDLGFMWAIFERATDGETSQRLTQQNAFALTPSTPELSEAFRLHHLRWND